MDSSTDLICLSYSSTASFTTEPRGYGVDPEITRILVNARRFNSRKGIGGVLYFGHGYFFQYLEGHADAVDCLYARICRDDRHREVTRMTRRPVRTRRFENWSMKFVAIERVVGEVLQRHGMNEFDPYRFTPALIDDLVVSCIHGEDDAPDAQPRPRARATGFWNKLLGPLGRG